MSTVRADIVAAARQWLGTPWVHQARLRGVGVDCIGLVGEVAVQSGVMTPRAWAQISQRWCGYSPHPNDATLQAACAELLQEVPTPAALPGDVLLMHFGAMPQHLAIITEHTPSAGVSILHAYMRARRVVEHRLDVAWAQRVVACYSFPAVAR